MSETAGSNLASVYAATRERLEVASEYLIAPYSDGTEPIAGVFACLNGQLHFEISGSRGTARVMLNEWHVFVVSNFFRGNGFRFVSNKLYNHGGVIKKKVFISTGGLHALVFSPARGHLSLELSIEFAPESGVGKTVTLSEGDIWYYFSTTDVDSPGIIEIVASRNSTSDCSNVVLPRH